MLDPKVFKAYDVRGLYPAELDEAGAEAIGRAYVEQFEPRRIAVGRDMRLSSPAMQEALMRGAAAAGADAVLGPDAPFHIHFSDIQFANRNETKHLPYGEGTLRAEPLRDALARFERPATVISESPDATSTRLIGDLLFS